MRQYPAMTWAILMATIMVYSLGNPDVLKLWPAAAPEAQAWQLLTYSLTHANWVHLLVNMLALLSFGPALEQTWGSWRFLGCYTLCAVIGGLIQVLIADAPTVGASGALFGMFAAYAWQYPKRKIISLVPWPLPAWAVLLVYVIVSGLAWAFGWAIGVAHAVHVTGAITGVLCAIALNDKATPR